MERVKTDSKRIVRVRADSAVPEMMRSGHTNKSDTFIPAVESDKDLTYLDCPGFLDNRYAVDRRSLLAMS